MNFSIRPRKAEETELLAQSYIQDYHEGDSNHCAHRR